MKGIDLKKFFELHRSANVPLRLNQDDLDALAQIGTEDSDSIINGPKEIVPDTDPEK